MLIKVNDIVFVITGDDAGARGKVLKVDRKKNRVTVEGVNRVYKHVKPSEKNPQGGRLSREMPVAVSNLMLIDPKTNQPTRVGIRIRDDGSKERYSKKSGASMGVIAPARK
jgi:large subunit ribosomal protein L24